MFVFILTPKPGRKEFIFLLLFLLAGFLIDAFSMIRVFVFHQGANTIISVGSLFDFSFLLLFYRSLFKQRSVRAFISIIIIIHLCFAIINSIFIQGISNTSTYTFVFRSIAFIVISLLYFYTLIRELPTERITKLPMFWINTAVLLYSSGTFFQWLLLGYIINNLKGDVVNTYTIKNALGVVFYLVITVGLWYNRSLYLSKPDPA